jgi:ribonuclease T2
MWIDAAKEGVHNAADALRDVAPQTTNMPSLRTLSKLAFGGAQVLLGGQGVRGTFTQQCDAPQLSCHNTTVVENLCCFNAPGGQILQTQFWDTNPPTGPDDSWTLHGLWYVWAIPFHYRLCTDSPGPTDAMAHTTQTATRLAPTPTSPRF